MTSKEFIKENIDVFNWMKENYEKYLDWLDKFIKKVDELIKSHDETNIDYMTDVGVDMWTHISLMKKELATLKIYIELTALKYKRMLMKEWEDKWEAMDKIKLIEKNYFSQVEIREAELEWFGRLFTIFQWEIKKLWWDKRAGEFLSLNQ